MKKFLAIILMLTTFLQVGYAPNALAQNFENPDNGEIMQIRSRRSGGQIIQTLYWGQSVFYQYADGSISAPSYNKQTIRDFASLLRHLGYRQINFTPIGSQGAIPRHLRDFAWWTMSEYGVRVLNYTPTYGVIYWGSSTFYLDSQSRIYANHYTHKTIDDLARLYYAMGITHVAFIPHGQTGAIPGHLRGYAIQKFAQYGVSVVNDGQPGTKKRGKKGGGRKPKPEDIFLDLMFEIIRKG